jgi:hypothetical protein
MQCSYIQTGLFCQGFLLYIELCEHIHFFESEAM